MSTTTMSRRAAEALEATKRRERGDADPTPVELLYEAINRAIGALEAQGWPDGEIIDRVYDSSAERRDETVIWQLMKTRTEFAFNADGDVLFFASRLGWQLLSRRYVGAFNKTEINNLAFCANSIADRLLERS